MAAFQLSSLVTAETERNPSRCGRGSGAGVSSWEGEAPAGKMVVVQEAAHTGLEAQERLFLPETASWEPSWSRCRGALWTETAGGKTGAHPGARAEAQRRHRALFIPPDKTYHKQIERIDNSFLSFVHP